MHSISDVRYHDLETVQSLVRAGWLCALVWCLEMRDEAYLEC